MIIDIEHILLESPFCKINTLGAENQKAVKELLDLQKELVVLNLPTIPYDLDKMFKFYYTSAKFNKEFNVHVEYYCDDRKNKIIDNYNFNWDYITKREAVIEMVHWRNGKLVGNYNRSIKATNNASELIEAFNIKLHDKVARCMIVRVKNFIFNDYNYAHQITRGINVLRMNSLGGGSFYLRRNTDGTFTVCSNYDFEYAHKADLNSLLCILCHLQYAATHLPDTIKENLNHLCTQITSYWNYDEELAKSLDELKDELNDIFNSLSGRIKLDN